MKFLATLCFVAFHTGTLCCVPEKSCKGVPAQLPLWIPHTAPWNFSEGPVYNEFSAPTIGTALSVRQRKWRCGKTPVSMRGGNIQQMEWWHFMVKPPLPCGTIKDCTYWRWAAGCNSEFSFPCHGKWLIPQLSLLHEISETWACNKFFAYSTPHVERTAHQTLWISVGQRVADSSVGLKNPYCVFFCGPKLYTLFVDDLRILPCHYFNPNVTTSLFPTPENQRLRRVPEWDIFSVKTLDWLAQASICQLGNPESKHHLCTLRIQKGQVKGLPKQFFSSNWAERED